MIAGCRSLSCLSNWRSRGLSSKYVCEVTESAKKSLLTKHHLQLGWNRKLQVVKCTSSYYTTAESRKQTVYGVFKPGESTIHSHARFIIPTFSFSELSSSCLISFSLASFTACLVTDRMASCVDTHRRLVCRAQ